MVKLAERIGLNEVSFLMLLDQGLPEWARQEPDQARYERLRTAFGLGMQQMFDIQDRTLTRPVVFVGGLGVYGDAYKVGRSTVATPLEYAQRLVSLRNLLTRYLSQPEHFIEVISVVGQERAYLRPDAFDVVCINLQMNGALYAFNPITDDYRVGVILARALNGETFTAHKPGSVKIFNGNGNGYE